MFLLFIVKYDSEEELNAEMMFSGAMSPEMLDRIFNNEIYKKAVLTWLPFLNKRGFLDALDIEEQKSEKKEE